MEIEEIYRLTGGNPDVTTDSRDVRPGCIFFALRGPHFDGNAFVAAALRAGAAWAVADDPEAVRRGAVAETERGAKGMKGIVGTEGARSGAGPERSDGRKTPKAGAEAEEALRAARAEKASPEDRIAYVPDSLTALQEMAALHRRRMGIPILAITGSNGKTTTKELTAAVLGRRYRVGATAGNLNNHIGVPLTLLGFGPQTEIGIVEMGASAQGEIASLCRIAAPDYGIITNIGRAHLEGFGGPQGVKAGKGELYDALARSGGTALVCADDRTLRDMAQERGLRTALYPAEPGPRYSSALEGDYNRRNIAAAAAVGRLFGVPEDLARAAIKEYVPRNNRSQTVRTERNTLIMDCYNANPSSMAAALENFFGSRSPEPADGGEKVARPAAPGTRSPSDVEKKYVKRGAILGDMLELGRWSEEEHRRILEAALAGRPARLWLVGPRFGRACETLAGVPDGIAVTLCDDCQELCSSLEAERPSGYLILIKGSRGIGLEKAAGLL